PAFDALFAATTRDSANALTADGADLVIVEPIPIARTDPTACLVTARYLEMCRYVAPTNPTAVEQMYRRLDARRPRIRSPNHPPPLRPPPPAPPPPNPAPRLQRRRPPPARLVRAVHRGRRQRLSEAHPSHPRIPTRAPSPPIETSSLPTELDAPPR